MHSTKHFDISVDSSLNITGYLYHWPYFYEWLSRCLVDSISVKNYDNIFYKIHSTIQILCVSKEQKNRILKQVNLFDDVYTRRRDKLLEG